MTYKIFKRLSGFFFFTVLSCNVRSMRDVNGKFLRYLNEGIDKGKMNFHFVMKKKIATTFALY